MRRAVLVVVVLATLALAAPATAYSPSPALPTADQIGWRHSRALGMPWHGRLVKGVQLPAEGQDFFTWDPILELAPNRSWRRWGTDRLLLTVLRVLHEYRVAHPDAARVGIADLSRPRGGIFDERFGGLGHESHQNGRDADIYYPRLDRAEIGVDRVSEVDRRLAQDLVNRFVAAGVQYVFVGPRTGLRGRKGVVNRLRFHDDHMHVRVW